MVLLWRLIPSIHQLKVLCFYAPCDREMRDSAGIEPSCSWPCLRQQRRDPSSLARCCCIARDAVAWMYTSCMGVHDAVTWMYMSCMDVHDAVAWMYMSCMGVHDAVAWMVAGAALLMQGYACASGDLPVVRPHPQGHTYCTLPLGMTTTSWAWTCHGRWKCPTEITARTGTSSETACGKNTSPLIRSVNASQGRRDSGCLSNLVIYSPYI